jgi:hypothetical protein
MKIFTTWLSTGRVPWVRLTGDPELENLWVLGKSLGARAFQNDVMCLIFTDYDCWSLNASYTFRHTTPDDKLRLFMVDLITSNGPFSEESGFTGEERREWVEMLAGGEWGEVVRACVERGFDKEDEVEPTMAGERWRYLEVYGDMEKEGESTTGPAELRRERFERMLKADNEEVMEKEKVRKKGNVKAEKEKKEKAELPMRVLRPGKRV